MVGFNNSVFKNCGIFDENFPVCEDYELWLRISSKYKFLYLQDKLLTKYGGHSDQLSTKYWGMDRFRVKAIEKNLCYNGLLYRYKNEDDFGLPSSSLPPWTSSAFPLDQLMN